MTLLEKKEYVAKNICNVPKEELELFNFNFACVYTKNSTGIEKNNPISVEDVVSVIKGYPVRCEENLKRTVYNHYKAYNYLLDQINEKREFSEDFLKDVHEILLQDLYGGGLYRNVNIRINGSEHIPCDYLKIYDRMTKYINDVRAGKEDEIKTACYAHLQLAKIHPFLDGNGRLARLMLNYVLINNGFAPISIPAKRRNEYFNTLEQFKINKTTAPFEAFVENLLNLEYDRIIDLINRH